MPTITWLDDPEAYHNSPSKKLMPPPICPSIAPIFLTEPPSLPPSATVTDPSSTNVLEKWGFSSA